MTASYLKSFGQRWFINTIAVVVAAHVVQGIYYDTVVGLLVASLILGILNTFLRPVLMLFSLPLLIATLGLFTLVINALLLYLVGWLVEPFHVEGFAPAFWGALVISLVSLLVNWMTGSYRNPSYPASGPGRSCRGPGDGNGPIIDV